MNKFDFSQALNQLKLGNKLCREGWNGKNMYIEIQIPDLNSKMTLSYIVMRTVQENLVPWIANQSDILANDWLIYYE